MILIDQYMQRSQAERQQHLDLAQPCDERGGFSTYFKGLLAYHCGTSIPSGKRIHVCHACHNSKCSNVQHLYWGTPAENYQDAISNGNKPIWDNLVAKYGLEGAKRRNARSSSQAAKAGRVGGQQNKSLTHRENLAKAMSGCRRFTNGKVTLTLKPNDVVPEGFVPGMAPRKRM